MNDFKYSNCVAMTDCFTMINNDMNNKINEFIKKQFFNNAK